MKAACIAGVRQAATLSCCGGSCVCFDACTLRPVAGGLAKRPYRRVALAWPTVKAEPLACLSLAAWSEARLIVHWRSSNRQIACAALLAVGEDGPDPAQALRSSGWKAWTLPKSLGPKLANNALPSALPFPRAWSQAPTLMWSRPAIRRQGNSVLPEASVADTTAVHQLLAAQE